MIPFPSLFAIFKKAFKRQFIYYSRFILVIKYLLGQQIQHMGICASQKKGKKEEHNHNQTEERLNEAELRDAIDKLYQEYDKDKNGTLDKEEVTKLLKSSLGRGNLSDQEVQKFMKEIDINRDNKIEKNELFTLYKKLFF